MGKKVLVVDDEHDIVNFMERFLIRMGISVVKATSGDLALDLFHQEGPDCVFLDVQMPGRDGIQTLLDIKSVNAAVPVIMITGKEGEEHKRKALECGAADYITKPIDLSELNDKIQAYLFNIKS